MTTKPILTEEEKVNESTQKYGRRKGKSLSDTEEKSITAQEESTPSLSRRVTQLMGVIKVSENLDWKKELGTELGKKYR